MEGGREDTEKKREGGGQTIGKVLQLDVEIEKRKDVLKKKGWDGRFE